MSSRERVDRKELFPLAHHHHHQRILNTDTQLICKIIKCNIKMTFFMHCNPLGSGMHCQEALMKAGSTAEFKRDLDNYLK